LEPASTPAEVAVPTRRPTLQEALLDAGASATLESFEAPADDPDILLHGD